MQNNQNPTQQELIFEQFRLHAGFISVKCIVPENSNFMTYDITRDNYYHSDILRNANAIIVNRSLPLTAKIENVGEGTGRTDFKLVLTYVDVPNEIVNRNPINSQINKFV